MLGRTGLLATLAWVFVLGWTPATGSAAGPGERRARRQGRADRDSAPKLGEIAPVFKLKRLGQPGEVDLASFKGERPVLLFFGSYT